MRTIWMSLLGFGLILISIPTMAASTNGSDLPLSKGSMIRILNYDAATKTYKIEAANFPGEGESWVTPEALASVAASAVNLRIILKNPESIKGHEFQIDKDLPTLLDNERQDRSGNAAATAAPVKKSPSKSGAR